METILEGDFDKRPKHQARRPRSPNIPSSWYSFVNIERGVVFIFFFFLRGERERGFCFGLRRFCKRVLL